MLHSVDLAAVESPALLHDYDYLIVGGGAAGLSLAYHISQEPRLADKRVLILEPEAKDRNDRTWSFWADAPTLFDGIVSREWERLAFRSSTFEQVFELKRHRYKMIRGLDFYRFTRAELADNPQFTWLSTTVNELIDTPTGARASTPAGDFTARFAFDSRPPQLADMRRPHHRYLLQHFVGWEVETEHDAFDPTTAEFMDFRGAQGQEVRFMYVLPFSPRRALVEYTLFSETMLDKAAYETELRRFMAALPKAGNYRITAEEVGAVPMTDHPLPTRQGAHVLSLGTRAGRAKPSSGYAFKRILAHSARLTQALATTGHPPRHSTGDRWQFLFFDTLMLDIMQRRGEITADIFSQLFQRNPVERVFDFLDERTSWKENFQVMNSLTPWPFLRSIWHVVRRRPGRRSRSQALGQEPVVSVRHM